jgi:hypothetical protein
LTARSTFFDSLQSANAEVGDLEFLDYTSHRGYSMQFPASNMPTLKLRLVNGPKVLLPYLTAGHPVITITCWDLTPESIFKVLGRAFGSRQPVTVVKLGGPSNPRSFLEDLIPYLVHQNPEVCYLGISDGIPRRDSTRIQT